MSEGENIDGEELAQTGTESMDADTAAAQSMMEADENARQVNLARLKMVLDVPLKVTVELGRTRLLVNDLLQLGQGSVIELDKMAGEPMEVYVNDKLVAMGEVVVVNEKFGVRLTDVMSTVGVGEVAPRDLV